ncbi:MAG: PKD domain-containing protein [Bacteroidetes bacterium]|nr:PKD domain-containing protein [Bacteroidota bacterium]
MKTALGFWFCLSVFFFQSFEGKAQCSTLDFKVDVTKGCAPLVVKFGAVKDTAVKTIEWDFGSGFNLGKDSIYKIFTVAGKYTISIRATLKNGSVCNTITKVDFIEVLPVAAPNIIVQPGRTLCSGQRKITFIDSTLNTASRDWVINGKSHLNTPQLITDSFLTTGYKSLLVVVVNKYGCSSIFSDDKYINVTDSAASNFCAAIKETNVGITADFTPNVFASDRTVSSYLWSFSGGSPSTDTTSSPTGIKFPTTGFHPVTLKVKLSDGCIFSKTIDSFI